MRPIGQDLGSVYTVGKCRGDGQKDPGGAMICENNGRETRGKKYDFRHCALSWYLRNASKLHKLL